MQVRTVVERMPGRVEVVVASGESRVQRALHPGLLAVQLPIVVIVLAAIDLGAAAKHLEGVDKTVLAARQVVIKSRQNSLLKSNNGWGCAAPAVSRPWSLSARVASTPGNGCDKERGGYEDPLH